MTPEALESQFTAVASALNAEVGSANYYRGQVEGAPFLLKLISSDPPAYLIKLRMTEPHNLRSSWPGTLSEDYADANIDCEIEGDYIFLWIRDASSLDAADVVALVRSCVEHHGSYFPESIGHCFDCGTSGTASIVQSSASITSICEECLSRRSAAQKSEEVRLNESTSSLAILLPAAIALSAFGWALFWSLYDAAFAATNSDRVWAPQIVIIAVVLGVGFGLGWPVGKLLHRSGLVKRFSPGWLAASASFLALVLGELLFATYTVHRVTGAFDFGLALSNVVLIASGDNIMYALLKLGFAITFAAAIFHIAKPKVARLTL
ncbi:hypothetical protein [Haloferula sargassicola]|uniref:Uncharacterized protein n=1 Tax=Haloferula sargassicola TaxID=490096 RepID=A0ABP9UT21_9BACT